MADAKRQIIRPSPASPRTGAPRASPHANTPRASPRTRPPSTGPRAHQHLASQHTSASPASPCAHQFPTAAKHAPVITLFFIWRLKGAPRHAYSLIKDIRDVGFLQCKPSTVYALLSKMEKAGLVKSHVVTKGSRVRRQYQATAKGAALLASTKASRIKGVWREFVSYLLSPS